MRMLYCPSLSLFSASRRFPGARSQITELNRNIQLPQLALCNALAGPKFLDPLSSVMLLRFRRAEGLDHLNSV